MPIIEEAARRFGAQVVWHAYELRPEPIPLPDPDSEYIREHWENRVLPMAGQRGLVMKVPKALGEVILAHRYSPAVAADMRLAERLGVRGVPAMFVTRGDDPPGMGVPVSGAVPLEYLQTTIARALSRAQ